MSHGSCVVGWGWMTTTIPMTTTIRMTTSTIIMSIEDHDNHYP
jgi:hypothetical protein